MELDQEEELLVLLPRFQEREPIGEVSGYNSSGREGDGVAETPGGGLPCSWGWLIFERSLRLDMEV